MLKKLGLIALGTCAGTAMIMGSVASAASTKPGGQSSDILPEALLSPGKAGDTGAASNLGISTERVGLIQVIQRFVNIFLGLLAFIVTIMLIYGGFLMITAAGDDGKYQKGLTILKQAAIGVAIVLLSFIIVNFVFRLVSSSATSVTAV